MEVNLPVDQEFAIHAAARKGRTDQPIGSQAMTYLLTVVMPVICWYTGIQPPSFLT